MTQLSRRSFLLACTASAVALALPSAAVAAPAKTIVLEGVRDAAGKYNVRVPADIASSLGKLRTAELTIASNRALRIAQNQNLARPKANGLLTRLWSPSLRAAPKGIVPTLVQAGLILGFAWALSNATGDLNKDATSTMTAGGAACEVYPALPSTVWARSTGIYRNSTGSQALAVQSTRATGGTGTLPAPAGWNNGGQRNAVALGGGSYEWEVQFTKNVACGERVAFPPTVPSGAVPGAEHAGTQVDTHSETNVGKIADAQHQKAVDDIKAGVPLPGGVIPGEVEDTDGGPITSVPVAQLDLGGLAFDWGQQVGDYVTPRAQIGNEDTHVKFPPEVPLPGAETPSPTPTPSPGATTSPIDWGTPPTGDMPGVPTPFAWMPTPWVAPDLPGSCQGLPYNFPVLKASGAINPCPVIAQARPVVRPVAVLGWTYFAIAQFLDL